ncbi:hypothetical protein LB941_00955 [Ligilactobacillus sp. WILCCON 0076]|uniref:Uncharacterized protein n=1 Tax=Ligilactobacillus ubinensis TaxID=2876789 RepID=A0A9X2FG85_9LACO|nr:hypothetical protein [Ligilactobacillus ubinensis]MCP0885902.1 hypothetical protein [Ligilactobacillus ubinensis]
MYEVGDKKYYLKILGWYVSYDSMTGNITQTSWKTNAHSYTQSEIDELQKLAIFQPINLEKCKEEAVD